MKTIFIKDDRLREIEADLCTSIVRLQKSGRLKGSYTVEMSTKEFKTNRFPGYAIYFGWEITDYEDDWKIKEKERTDGSKTDKKDNIKI